MAFESFHFLRPLWLLALVPAAALLLAATRRTGRASAWSRLVDAHLLRHLLIPGENGTARWPLWALGAAWLTACVALAGPAWERLPQPVFRTIAPTVVAIDLSRSMETTDLSPSRRMRARYELQDLLRRSREGQIGLVVYSDEPFVAVPLTDDAAVVEELLPSLTGDLMPADGDRADRALDQASALLAGAGAPGGRILLLTDGVGANADAARAAAARAADDGRSVSVLGIASEEVLERERPSLEAIAAAGAGSYADLRADDGDLDRVLGGGLVDAAPVRETDLATGDAWRDAGVFLLLVPLLLAPLAFRRGWLVAAALWLALAPAERARAASTWNDLWKRPDQQGAEALAAGRSAEAAELFQDPAWRAAAQYEAGRYQEAAESYAELGGVDGDYNRGNALARAGELERALEAYDEALAAAPGHADARFNRDLVERLQQQRDRQQAENPQDGEGGESGERGGEADQSSGESASEAGAGSGSQARQQDGTPQEAAGSDAAAGEPPPSDAGRDTSSASGEDPAGAPPEAAGAGSPASPEHEEGEPGAEHASAPEAGTPDPSEQAASEQAADATSPSNVGSERPSSPRAGEPDPAVQARPRPDAADPEAHSDDTLSDQVSKSLADSGASAEEPQNPSAPSDPAGTAPGRSKPLGEAEQAREQRLRQVPDDPGGLLRAKIHRRHAERRYAQEDLVPW